MPSGTVADNQEVFVQFPGEFEEAFYKKFNPGCKLYKKKDDWSGNEGDDLVQNCSFVKGRRVKMFLKKDTANAAAAKAYRLTVSSVPTPLGSSSGYTYPAIIVPSIGKTTLSKMSVPGMMNSTFYNFGEDSSKIFIDWSDDTIMAYIGVYKSEAMLIPGKKKRTFSEDVEFTTTASAFSFKPTTFAIKTGDKFLSFKFAPKASTLPGLQIIEFTTTKTNHAPMKPLRVQVVNTKCKINNPTSYDFPVGGFSLPYVLNF